MLILILSGLLQTAAAQVSLPEIESMTPKSLPIDTAQPAIPCDQIAVRLEAYDNLARQHDASISTFIYQVADKVSSWYAMLSPLEGTPQTLPSGVFAPLQDGQNKISDVANIAMDNSGLLANEMDRIKTSLAQCILTPR